MNNKPKTQLEWILKELNSRGKITRNQCLRVYITRLADYINFLRKKGWEFEAEYIIIGNQSYWGNGKSKDYQYTVTKKGLV